MNERDLYLIITAWQNVFFGIHSIIMVGVFLLKYREQAKGMSLTLIVTSAVVEYFILIYLSSVFGVIENSFITYLLRPAVSILLSFPALIVWSQIFWAWRKTKQEKKNNQVEKGR